VNEQEREHDDRKINRVLQHVAEVKLERRVRQGAEVRQEIGGTGDLGNHGVDTGLNVNDVPAGQLGDDAQHPRDKDAPQDGALDVVIEHDAREHNADQGERNSGAADVAERDLRGGLSNRDAGVLQADQRDEQAD